MDIYDKNKLVSIIIPVYNGEDKILKTLESLKNQTYQNFEILIVDDGSTDNTLKTIKNITRESQNFKIFTKDNGGVSSARNLGIENAVGKYICFLDADDFLENNYFETMFTKISDTNSDLIYCGYNIITEDGTSKANINFTNKKLLTKYLISSFHVQTACFLIKREILNVKPIIRFSHKLSWGEDIHFFTSILSRTNKTNYSEEFLVNYSSLENDKDRLSAFDISLVDKDVKYINHILNDQSINLNKKQRNILEFYRLPAQIIYKLMRVDNSDIHNLKQYYDKYSSIINGRITNHVGLRKLKVILTRKKLKKKVGY